MGGADHDLLPGTCYPAHVLPGLVATYHCQLPGLPGLEVGEAPADLHIMVSYPAWCVFLTKI